MVGHTSTKSFRSRVAFYATPEHECAYLPHHTARTLFADPNHRLDNGLYSQLILYGFRRSGRHVYRPSCPACEACVPVRIPVATFRPDRSQRRALRMNQDLYIRILAPEYRDEHFELYQRYVNARHPGGGMDNPQPMQYMEFLTSEWSHTLFVEFRDARRVLAVSVTDVLDHGLSAVYTFFDPASARRGLGTFAILWQLQECSRRGLDALYLGYWIDGCEKMDYKARFQPLEQFHQGQWRSC